MSQQADAEIIKQSVLGQDLSDQDAQLLATITRHQTLNAGDVLYQEGDQDNTLYVIVSGKVAVGKDEGGRWVDIATLKEGAIAGEMAFVDGSPHTLTLKALKSTEVITIKREDFESLVENAPVTCYHIMRAIIRNGHRLQKEMNARFLEMSRFIQNQYTM
ncbi:Cyclic nucleotide-binding domain-containing protein [Sulfurivirga caldicuralii]|uniref:Cyclic nucleotide-binding domain-containing protein n=1 Tax=Sulfurivirga caldicuralii TaxID=364032 RepID=A0A1N6EW09_9GAMM|nr:cyclic nucleotide-binding domain-containing protein [Sulfurivirga caldicuralii]SIN87176.1 Cyclic nucleotide-binding domain-containing protein [Sulfurivirga caldicuralii]